MATMEELLARGGKPSGGSTAEELLAKGGVAGEPEDNEPEETFLQPGPRRPFRTTATPKDIASLQSERTDATRAASITPIQAVGGMMNSQIDRFSGGAYGLGLRGISAAEKAIGVEGPASGALGSMEGMRRHYPASTDIADIPAYFGGIPAKLMEAGMAMKGASALSPLSRAGAASSLGAGTLAASEAASELAPPEDVLERGLTGAAAGGTFALGIGSGGKALGSLGRTVQNYGGGKSRQIIEKAGGEVGLKTPGKGGPFDTMDVPGNRETDIGEQAARSVERGAKMLRDEEKGVKRAIGSRVGRIERSPEGAQQIDGSGIVSDMRASLDELDIDERTAGKIESLLTRIEAKQGAGFNPETDSYLLSESDVNKVRRALGNKGKVGESTSAELGPLQRLFGRVKQVVDEGPFAEVNKEYATESARYRKSRRDIGLPEKSSTPQESQGKISQLTNRVMRRGQNTVTAGKQRPGDEAFAADHPDIEAEFQRPELLRRQKDISFRLLPEHGNLAGSIGHALAAHGTMPAIAGLALHSPLAAAAAMGGSLTLQNLPAIQARLLYGPALAAQAMEPMILREAPLLTAARTMGARE